MDDEAISSELRHLSRCGLRYSTLASRLSGSWRWMMSFLVKGVSSMRSFQYFGLMFSSSTACVYVFAPSTACCSY